MRFSLSGETNCRQYARSGLTCGGAVGFGRIAALLRSGPVVARVCATSRNVRKLLLGVMFRGQFTCYSCGSFSGVSAPVDSGLTKVFPRDWRLLVNSTPCAAGMFLMWVHKSRH